MTNVLKNRIVTLTFFMLSFGILTALPFNVVQAGACGDLIVLKDGKVVKETGVVSIPATDKSKWELKIITDRTRTACKVDWVRVMLLSSDPNNVKSPEETVIAAQTIAGGKDINKTVPLKISAGKHTYSMDSAKDNTFAPMTSNKVIINSARTDTTTQNPNTPIPSTPVDIPDIKNPVGGKTLSGLISQGINLLLTFIVIAAVVVIIIAGFRMAVGGGNPDQITKAKKTIIWAILGIVVAFMSFAIVRIIQGLL